MPNAPSRLTAVSIAALVFAACSSTPAPPDASSSTDASSSSDVSPSTDVSSSTDVSPSTDVASVDASTCEDFTGAYTLVGTCSVPGFSPFPSACITQTGCGARIVVSTGPTEGTVAGGALTFTSMVSGVPLQCTATRGAGGALTVRCAAGTIASCDAVATPVTFPGATRFCCDLGAQDCGAGQRCTLIGAGANNATALTACIPAGTITEGAMCARVDGRPGTDGCAAGLACINFGRATTGDRVCGRVCRSSADCTGGASCLAVSDAPRGGACVARCEPLGRDCPAGTCRYFNTWGAEMRDTAPGVLLPSCHPVGAGAEGAACATSTDCGADLACARRTGADPFACQRVCDMAHPCPMGTACSGVMSATNPAAGGTCLPP